MQLCVRIIVIWFKNFKIFYSHFYYSEAIIKNFIVILTTRVVNQMPKKLNFNLMLKADPLTTLVEL